MKIKDYQWNNPALKKKYQIFDFGSLGLVIAIFIIARFVANAMPIIIGILVAVVLAQWYCFRIKAQDKQFKKE